MATAVATSVATAPPACGDPNWTEPPNLAAIREVEAHASRRARMRTSGTGRPPWAGKCSMLRWAATTSAYAAPDHVHLFAPGYQATAEAAVPRHHGRLRAVSRAASRRPDAVPDARLPAVLRRRAGADGAVGAHSTSCASWCWPRASYFFYAQWNWHYCLLLAGSSLLTYAGGLGDRRRVDRSARASAIVGVTVGGASAAAVHLQIPRLPGWVGEPPDARVRQRPRAAVHGNHPSGWHLVLHLSRHLLSGRCLSRRCRGVPAARRISCCISRSFRSLSPARSCARRSSCRSLPRRRPNACRSPNRCC